MKTERISHGETTTRSRAGDPGLGAVPRYFRGEAAWTLVFALLVFLAPAHGADAPASGEDRLRAALRDASLQLRDAQAQLAAAQAAQAALTEENKALTQKFEALKKQVVADRAVADKALADATAQATEQKTAVARLNESLAKAREEGQKSADAAKAAEAEGARLKAENIALERRAADRQAKNLALFLLGNEILTRYEEFSLGNALKAKEPFVGVTRTRLENLVQDYQDKLLDARSKP